MTVLAHIAGLPLEETLAALVPAAAAAGALVAARLRLAVARRRDRGGEPRVRG